MLYIMFLFQIAMTPPPSQMSCPPPMPVVKLVGETKVLEISYRMELRNNMFTLG